VIDGRTGQQLAGRHGSFKAFRGFKRGGYVASGDVNGDGYSDIIVGAGGGGRPLVRVFSGANGKQLMELQAYSRYATHGVRVASADVNGDGRDDIIVAPEGRGGKTVKVFSGATKKMLSQWIPFNKSVPGGLHITAGDITGDGVVDLIAAQRGGATSQVTMLDGATRTSPGLFPSFADNFNGGVRLGLADVNLDGRLDVVMAAGPNQTPNHPQVGPLVRAFDGLSREAIDQFFVNAKDKLDGLFVGGS
jgi:hypothetical protein